jgi:hypothetical protein
MNTPDKIEELVKELRMVSNMINMGERIAWGRETALMDKAADALTTIYQRGIKSERERIEDVFKEKVPPHAMGLEDSVWLKRLLNKAFLHENIYK